MQDSATSKYSSVLMWHQTPPHFKHFFTRDGLAPGASIWWSHRPRILACSLPCLPGQGLRRGPTYHLAQLAFKELSLVPLTPSRQSSNSKAAGSVSWSPTPELCCLLQLLERLETPSRPKKKYLERIKRPEIRAAPLTTSSLPSWISCLLLFWQGQMIPTSRFWLPTLNILGKDQKRLMGIQKAWVIRREFHCTVLTMRFFKQCFKVLMEKCYFH